MAEIKINGLDREVWNVTVKEIAAQLYKAPEATAEQKKAAMVAAYGPMNYSNSLMEKLLRKAGVYVSVMRYFSENYFRLWCSELEHRDIVEDIAHLFQEDAWMVKEVKNSLFAKTLVSDQVRAMVKAKVSYQDILAYQSDQRSFITKRAKEIIGYRVRKEVFTNFCTEINYQLDQLIVAEPERLKMVRAQAQAQEERRKEEAEARAKAKEAKAAADAEILKTVLAGEKVKLEGDKYAFCCDLEIGKLLDSGALIHFGGVIYRRTKKGFDETKLRLLKDVEASKLAEEKAKTMVLPEKLNEVWVNLESSKGNKIFKVYIVPFGFTETSPEVLKRFKKEQCFAFKAGKVYRVWQMAEVAYFVGDCRQATKEEALVAKGEKPAPKTEPVPVPKVVKKGKKAKPPKNPDRPANREAGRKVIVIGSDVQPSGALGEKLAAAAVSGKMVTL